MHPHSNIYSSTKTLIDKNDSLGRPRAVKIELGLWALPDVIGVEPVFLAVGPWTLLQGSGFAPVAVPKFARSRGRSHQPLPPSHPIPIPPVGCAREQGGH